MQAKVRDERRRAWVGRRARVVRKLDRARGSRPRLTVFRSNKHIYAQIVDPVSGRTLAAVSTRHAGLPEVEGEAGGKLGRARRVGKAIAELARSREIDEVVFNRNGFLYHGRVKALAEAAREAGLRF